MHTLDLQPDLYELERIDMIRRLIGRGRSTARLVIARAALPLGLCLLTLACSAGKTSDAVEKAQIAVRANPALELVATDERQGVLTVRVKQNGQVITVSVNDVIAGTAFANLDVSSGGGRNGGGARNSSGTQRVDIAGSGGTLSVTRSGNSVAVGSAGAAGVQASNEPARQGVDVSGAGGQVSVRRSEGGGLAVDSPDGRVAIGPNGIVAVQGDSRAREAAPSERGPAGNASAAQSSNPSGRGAVIDESRLERRTRPVACKGDGSIDLSDVLLTVDDVAVTSVGSCSVHIRNSHIVGDVAVQSTGGTTVTIVNSIIEGRAAALQLKGAVNMSVQSSTIRGPVQRVGEASLRDLGGNLWR
jgi:hypothetical protein